MTTWLQVWLILFHGLFGQSILGPMMNGTFPTGGGATCCTVIDGATAPGTGGSTTFSASHNLNLAAHDQVWIYLSYPVVTNCATPTLTWSDTAGNSFTLVSGSSKVLNQTTGLHCSAQFQITDAIANSADTIQVVVSSGLTNSSGGFQAIQIRGTANAAADTQANYDASGGAQSTTVVPSMTSTVAKSIVVAGMNYSGPGVTATPTTNGCFSTTGSTPANTGNSSTTWTAVQYVILSSTASSTCSFDNDISVNSLAQGAIFH